MTLIFENLELEEVKTFIEQSGIPPNFLEEGRQALIAYKEGLEGNVYFRTESKALTSGKEKKYREVRREVEALKKQVAYSFKGDAMITGLVETHEQALRKRRQTNPDAAPPENSAESPPDTTGQEASQPETVEGNEADQRARRLRDLYSHQIALLDSYARLLKGLAKQGQEVQDKLTQMGYTEAYLQALSADIQSHVTIRAERLEAQAKRNESLKQRVESESNLRNWRLLFHRRMNISLTKQPEPTATRMKTMFKMS